MTLKERVIDVLKGNPETRNSDRLLICKVYGQLGIDIRRPFASVISDPLAASFESIRRYRQKAQEDNESLKADKKVKDMRTELESESPGLQEQIFKLY